MAEVGPDSWITAASLDEFAEILRIRDVADDVPRIRFPDSTADRLILAAQIREFHGRAGTLTEGVKVNLGRYARGEECVRAAHQPNFLPSVNVVAQAAVCHALNRLLDGAYAEVFFVVDYDLNDDRRYRHATLPSLCSRNGTWNVSAPEYRGSAAFMTDEAGPSREFAARLGADVRTWALQQISILPAAAGRAGLRRRVEESLESFVVVLEKAALGATGLADFNMLVLSWIVNRVLGLPTLFLSGSAALPLIADQIEAIWHSRVMISGTSTTVPLWKRCSCGARVALTAMPRRCGRCAAVATVSDDDVPGLAVSGRLVPRVVADDLLDGVAWGNVAGCDYRGGLPHYAMSARIARGLGLRPLPMFLSSRAPGAPAEHLIGGEFGAALAEMAEHPAARLISCGRTSVVLPLLWSEALSAERIAADMRGGD